MTLQVETASITASGSEAIAAPAPPDPPADPRWHAKLGLLLLGSVLTSLAFAPFGQFYLAWVGLVPLLMVIRAARSVRSAFGWAWLGGAIFFLLNLSYLLLVTVPGALALPLYLALYWGLAGVVIRRSRLMEITDSSAVAILAKSMAIAAAWVAVEWLRGFVFTGLPWLFIGYTQSPLLALCQISDITGVYGVMFVVVLVNALIAMTLLQPRRWRKLMLAWAVCALLLALSIAYGLWRLGQTAPFSPGPTVLVIQPSDRNFRDKAAIEKQRESVSFHMEQTLKALSTQPADLVAWSETTMPALNEEVWRELGDSPLGRLSQSTHRGLIGLTRLHEVSLLVGGFFVDYATVDGKRVPTGMRNSAFFYDRATNSQAARYDKIHLVPFGEFIPGKESYPWLYRIFLFLSPYTQEHAVSPGPADALTVFNLAARNGNGQSRFVAPICFDDIDPALMTRMFLGEEGTKRADFIVNLTNDGWFRWNEQPQHLQHALFRSIENRAPTARAVNTGISGFIDSCGRVGKTVPVGVVGTATQQLMLDRRVTFYTRFGDLFAFACLGASGLVIFLWLPRLQWRRTH